MFSDGQRQEIAKKVEEVLLSFNHPEMPTEKPRFQLHVEGVADWSWADIKPNWHYLEEGKNTPVNPFNEQQDKGLI